MHNRAARRLTLAETARVNGVARTDQTRAGRKNVCDCSQRGRIWPAVHYKDVVRQVRSGLHQQVADHCDCKVVRPDHLVGNGRGCSVPGDVFRDRRECVCSQR